MRVLYRNPDNQSLAITDVTSVKYLDEENLLVFFGDDDICIYTKDISLTDKLTRSLYEDGHLDLCSYACTLYDWPDDDDDDDVDVFF